MTPDDLVRHVRRSGRDLRLRSLVATVADPDSSITAAGPTAAAADHLYEIGSVTKLATGVLLAAMVLRGDVALTDPLSAHLPWDLPWRRGAEPTLETLATHRSGLGNTPRSLAVGEFALAAGLSTRDPWAGLDAAAYRTLVADAARRVRRPGTFRYSSLGIGLLGDALAARAGMAFEDLATQRVLQPLHMTRTTFARPAGEITAGHSARGTSAPFLQDRMPAAGALASTTQDVTRLLRAALPDSPAPARLREAVALAQAPRARTGPGAEVGLAWLRATAPRDEGLTLWHNGGTWGFSAFAAVRPGDGKSVVLLTDTCRPLDALGAELLGDA